MRDSAEQPQHPSLEQIAAMISVLGDDHGPLQRSARDQLLVWGGRAVQQLREGAEAEHMPTRARCRSLLRSIEVRETVDRLGALRLDSVGASSAPSLLEGALLATRVVRGFVPAASSLAPLLRREAASLKRACAGRSLSACRRALVEALHVKLGLSGCDAELLDVGHGHLVAELFDTYVQHRELIDRLSIDRVLERREGAPIALCLIYLLVTRWAGLSASGVALPGHFLIRLHGPRPLLIDPFHGGRVVTKSDCVRYLRRNGFDRPGDHLVDLNDREVMTCYLRCLDASVRRADAETREALQRSLRLLGSS